MLIETYASRMSMEKAHEIASHVLETAGEGVKVRPEELEPAKPEAAPRGAIPEGTVLGDGKITSGASIIGVFIIGSLGQRWISVKFTPIVSSVE